MFRQHGIIIFAEIWITRGGIAWAPSEIIQSWSQSLLRIVQLLPLGVKVLWFCRGRTPMQFWKDCWGVRYYQMMWCLSTVYRRFVDICTTCNAPLTNNLQSNRKFCWYSACDEAFQIAWKKLPSTPILASFDYDNQANESDFGFLGAVWHWNMRMKLRARNSVISNYYSLSRAAKFEETYRSVGEMSSPATTVQFWCRTSLW